ncbi:glycosyltransferase family 32 protein [Cylindrobasidium torrendii FP15055 ss-10]|uniref:Glycosyltransferase family 32 protein n=1 Tax=Cylindrobasidium torrendii FP15055 ss-10 TaxID=1314674 RepID=A0A0D7BEC6_9AGAR|nr:glycosyltransferase family 32 protein [Cylindrobasidium torrendii FP15055 ss-10]
MARRRSLCIFLTLLALILVGTVVVLSSITYYLTIDPSAYLSDDEVPILDRLERWNATAHGKVERIPRILHQTWRTETLPEKWQGISDECRELMPDYEYMLWTDASSRDFIAEHYPWFLDTFNDYTYPIERADAIRYFVLHHYGGVYLDLDIGCRRPLDPLLIYPVILPKTIPVGISNDLIFSEKGHPFMAQAIHSLTTWDHSWILNYPTVMFSTGPMFLSAQYAIYTSSHPASASDPIRVLARSLYGKNAKNGEAPNSFFDHFYGSSWHAEDAGFIAFLLRWGKTLMWVGLVVFIIGIISIFFPAKQRNRLRRMGGYEILFPRRAGSQSDSDDELPGVVGLPVDVRPPSPTSSEASNDHYGRSSTSGVAGTVRAVRNRIAGVLGFGGDDGYSRVPSRRRSQRYSRGVLFFLPAMFTPQSQDVELGGSSSPPAYQSLSRQPSPDAKRLPREEGRSTEHETATTSRTRSTSNQRNA